MISSGSSTALRVYALSAFVLGAVACGGGGAAGAITVADDDAGIDAGSDAASDASPGSCGVGACMPGASCFDGCNTCYCDELGWACTAMACPDAGPDAIEPLPACPSDTPKEREPCTREGQSCAYPNDCSGKTTAECVLGPMGMVWRLDRFCNCPSSMPTVGATCPAPLTCGYRNACGTWDTAVCELAGGKWSVTRGDCAPPPPPTCPGKRPAAGSACPEGVGDCKYDNGCGAVDHAYCIDGRWTLKDTPCVPGCPASKPASGTACKSPSSVSCTYVVFSMCTTSCFCAEDYRWACYPAPCAPPTPGG